MQHRFRCVAVRYCTILDRADYLIDSLLKLVGDACAADSAQNAPARHQQRRIDIEVDVTSIAERLVAIRQYLGESQKGMAKRVGLGAASWQRLELENRAPKGPALSKLEELGFSTRWLLTGEGPMRERDEALEARLNEVTLLLETPERAAELEESRLDAIRAELSALVGRPEVASRYRVAADRILALRFKDSASLARWEAHERGTHDGIDLGIMIAEDRARRPEPAAAPQPLRLIGLAECGLKGWYQGDSMAVTVTRPGDLVDPAAFAVIAIGRSMEPEGIRAGYLCFCSPSTPATEGDAVYIGRRDGKGSIKRFRALGGGWLTLEGWVAEGDAPLAPYTEKVALSEVNRLAPVIYVKRKL